MSPINLKSLRSEQLFDLGAKCFIITAGTDDERIALLYSQRKRILCDATCALEEIRSFVIDYSL